MTEPEMIDTAEANIRADHRAGRISKEQFQKEMLIMARARQQAQPAPPQLNLMGADQQDMGSYPSPKSEDTPWLGHHSAPKLSGSTQSFENSTVTDAPAKLCSSSLTPSTGRTGTDLPTSPTSNSTPKLESSDTAPPQPNLEGLSDAQVEAVLHLVESRLCIIWPKIGAREEFANLLRVLEPAPEEEAEICEACGEPFEDGDMVYWMADDTGHIHADCCGPERESYVGPDGEPLKDGEPIPEPFAYRDPRATTEGSDNG